MSYITLKPARVIAAEIQGGKPISCRIGWSQYARDTSTGVAKPGLVLNLNGLSSAQNWRYFRLNHCPKPSRREGVPYTPFTEQDWTRALEQMSKMRTQKNDVIVTLAILNRFSVEKMVATGRSFLWLIEPTLPTLRIATELYGPRLQQATPEAPISGEADGPGSGSAAGRTIHHSAQA